MNLALRPYATAGIALVGASVIAATPLAPATSLAHSPLAVPVSSAAVSLSSSVDPLTRWGEVATAAFNNVNGIATYMSEHPFPLLQQVIANQTGYAQILITGLPTAAEALAKWATETMPTAFETAFAQVQAGQPQAAADTLTIAIGAAIWAGMTLSPAINIPGQIMQNLTATVKTVIGLPTITPLIAFVNTAITSPIQALGITAQSFTDSMGAGDTLGALNAVANLPAELVDQLLNKTVLDFRLTGGGRFISGALLTNLLIKIPKAITAAITPPAPPAIASVPDPAVASGTTLALSTDTAADATAPSATATPTLALTAEPADEAPAAAVEATPETPAVESASPPADSLGKPLVRQSLVATPGKGNATTNKPAAKVASDFRDGISSTVNKIGESVKKAFTKPEKKPASATSSDKGPGSSSSSDSK